MDSIANLIAGLARSAVYCACGAQWHGKTIDRAAAVIAIHAARGRQAGNKTGCRLIPHGEFRARFGRACQCEACQAERRRAWAERRRRPVGG